MGPEDRRLKTTEPHPLDSDHLDSDHLDSDHLDTVIEFLHKNIEFSRIPQTITLRNTLQPLEFPDFFFALFRLILLKKLKKIYKKRIKSRTKKIKIYQAYCQ